VGGRRSAIDVPTPCGEVRGLTCVWRGPAKKRGPTFSATCRRDPRRQYVRHHHHRAASYHLLGHPLLRSCHAAVHFCDVRPRGARRVHARPASLGGRRPTLRFFLAGSRVHVDSKRLGHQCPIICLAVQDAGMGREFRNVSRLAQALAHLRPGLERHYFGVAVSHCFGLEITMLSNPALQGKPSQATRP
jgi:hypothetical protein